MMEACLSVRLSFREETRADLEWTVERDRCPKDRGRRKWSAAAIHRIKFVEGSIDFSWVVLRASGVSAGLIRGLPPCVQRIKSWRRDAWVCVRDTANVFDLDKYGEGWQSKV